MRIAYVSADHGIPVFGDKGASIHIHAMVNAFAGMGHELDVLAARLGAGDRDGLRARALKVYPAEPGMGPGPRMDDAGRAAKERRYLEIGHAIEEQLVRMHARAPFDFLYERYSLWSTAGVRAARRLQIPCVVEVNAPLMLEQQRYRKLELAAQARAVETEVFTVADRVVAVSEPVREYVIAKGARADAVSMLPNAVDVGRFHPEVDPTPMPWADDDFVIGFVGSLKPWHGVDSLLRAFARLHRADPRYRLLVVGDGPLRSWIDGFACGAGIEDRITVTGWVANDQLPGLVQRMHVTLAPYPELESFYFSPLKLFEYMAMAKPVVASDVGQIGDLIQTGSDGLLTRPGDVDALVSQVSRLRDDESLRRRIGAGALRRARAWTWNDSARRVIDLVGGMRRAA